MKGLDLMKDCTVKITFPKKVLKGAGLKKTSFLPSWIYNIKISIKNNSEYFKICSFNSTFANGITYLNNLSVNGPDYDIINFLKFVEPNLKVGNDNLIVFANNFKLSPLSENIITFDIAINNNYTSSSIENSGAKISHKTTLNINTYLLNDGNIYSDNISTEAMDYLIEVNSDTDKLKINEKSKIYINCKAGQYDSIRKVYLKCSLDSGFDYLTGTTNIEPKNLYLSNNRTILKWFFDIVNQGECKKIGFKVMSKSKYKDESTVKIGDNLINSINSNGVNNSTYTQCPDTCRQGFFIV
ncbi:hypothetical protein JYG23_10625 [Sedimentibacter sp. zth1]|uniref:hypothetical protein n=1 Tax=Sedimentibacter sp. zth1 TaxID=2816908 RepID=UPI001A90CE86|nr:hypothetical protein [Sedimentibacter sp. zth1]QSX05136.1 hypothetical protein JYG23_10625 [Sedimentibacter sp. zth1]